MLAGVEKTITGLEVASMGTVTIRWVEGVMMVGTDSTGHSIVLGRSPDNPEQFAGVKPSDLLLLAAASCSAHDVIEILRKQREPLEDLKVVCRGEQQSEPPYTFTQIQLHYIATGAVSVQKLEKAIQLSEEKYCSVLSTLRPGVPISSDYEIIEAPVKQANPDGKN
jgi:putative redox protein